MRHPRFLKQHGEVSYGPFKKKLDSFSALLSSSDEILDWRTPLRDPNEILKLQAHLKRDGGYF